MGVAALPVAVTEKKAETKPEVKIDDQKSFLCTRKIENTKKNQETIFDVGVLTQHGYTPEQAQKIISFCNAHIIEESIKGKDKKTSTDVKTVDIAALFHAYSYVKKA
jgi:uncharacterized membrane-anchored protein